MIGNKGGRPSHWKSSNKTRLVRIPEHMADEILKIARLKDSEEINIYISDESATEKTISKEDNKLEKIIQIVEAYKSKAHPTSVQWRKANELIKELEEELV